jgi:hypothetical protein
LNIAIPCWSLVARCDRLFLSRNASVEQAAQPGCLHLQLRGDFESAAGVQA